MHRRTRRGATVVEMAFIAPVFFLFVFALFEFGHALMVINYLTSVSKQAAHLGSFEDVSTSEVTQFASERMDFLLGSDVATISIKNAAAYETGNSSSLNVSSLPSVELENLDSRGLFMVHIEVPYNSVSLLPPFWIKNQTLSGVSVMRRE